jgi:hypothetical protein
MVKIAMSRDPQETEIAQRQAARTTVWGATRTWVARTSLVGLICVLANIAMGRWALTRGIHCPVCDRFAIESGFAWWEAFWQLKDTLLLLGGGIGLVAVVVGRPRWFGAVVLAIAGCILLCLTYR